MKQLNLNLNRKGDSLITEIISLPQLRKAYQAVRRNKGAPGIDGVTVNQFGEHLEENLRLLQQEVEASVYEPKPVRRVEMEKPDGTGVRKIGIPIIRDRVLHYSLKMSLEPLFEPEFSESSYGFRPGRNQGQALQAAKAFVQDGNVWCVDIDLEKCFDRLNHDKIIHLLKQKVTDRQVLRLVGLTLRSGVMHCDNFEPTEEGATQGSPLSPLLSNIVLHELDLELQARGLSFCRYADDCNIFVKSQKAAERVMTSVTRFIERKMKLTVNPAKSKVALATEVKFLGFTIVNGMIVIAKKSMARAFDKVRELTPRRTHIPIEQQMEAINRWYQGWTGYYRQTEIPAQLQAIEARIRRRLRAQFVRNHKRRRFLYRKLQKMGIHHRQAMKVYSNLDTWALSHLPAVDKAWSVEWFRKRGFKTVAAMKLPHWQPLNVWVKLM